MAQNGIINRSGEDHYQVTWHRDLNYQHFVSSRQLAISALYCIDDFSEATGATYLLPASHRSETFPSDAYVHRHQTAIEAPAGSVLVFERCCFTAPG